jgi:glycosyltransferase involved in cell wall biosynthesis
MTGEMVAFLDADDAYHPLYLQRLMEAIEKDHSDMSICEIHQGVDYDDFLKAPLKDGTSCIDQNVALFKMYDNGWALMISPCNKLYNKELFKNLRFPEGRCFEDLPTINRAIFNCRQISILDAELYFYHITPSSASKTKRSVELLDREWALRSHWKFLCQNGKKDLAYQAVVFYLEKMIDTYHRILSSDKPEDCSIIRARFTSTYRKYRRKINISPELAEKIFEFRYPTLSTILCIVRRDGIVKTSMRFIRKRLGMKK